MTQTSAVRNTSHGSQIAYTPPSGDVTAGDVVQIGSVPLVATQAIDNGVLGALATDGVFDVPKTTDVFTVGDAVYWNSGGTDVGANTGAADNTTGNIMGLCVANATNNATHVATLMTAAKRTNTIAGSVTADDITGSDSNLGITGVAGSAGAGGIVAVAGGAGDAGAGGAVSLTGGAGETSGAGGASTVEGGAGGGTAGDGGAITVVGGDASAGNDNGGAVSIDGGAKHGTGADGAIIIGGTNAASLTVGIMPRIPVASVAAAGGNIAPAAAITAGDAS